MIEGMKMKRVTLVRTVRARVEEDLYQLIVARAAGTTESAVVREALRVYAAVLRALAAPGAPSSGGAGEH